jgi:hypothetical protein
MQVDDASSGRARAAPAGFFCVAPIPERLAI